jgi:hypothetical protein
VEVAGRKGALPAKNYRALLVGPTRMKAQPSLLAGPTADEVSTESPVDVAKLWVSQRRKQNKLIGNMTTTSGDGAQGHAVNFFAFDSDTDRIREILVAAFQYRNVLVAWTEISLGFLRALWASSPLGC